MGNKLNIEAVLIPDLRLNLHSLEIPSQWQDLEDDFADQDTTDVQAQILVGADRATMFPTNEMDDYEVPVEVPGCRLLRSRLTGKLIMFGACQNEKQRNSEGIQVNNVRARINEDVLVEPMNMLAIDDIEPIHPDTDMDTD